MLGKSIVLLLDGTWNDSDAGDSDTNIVRLRELIVSSLDRNGASQPAGAAFVRERTFKGRPVVMYYDRGVGTGGFLDKYFGGALGAGLEGGVRRAYRFLANTFEPNDEVFIFGFSRGSYTARSLAGFIAAVGLLRQKENNAVNESQAWYFYRTSPKDRLQTLAKQLQALGHVQRSPLIACLGVFDTVGARGIPINWFWRENRDLFEFHDVELSGICRTNLHALAIDEHREAFQATIWRSPRFVDISSATEQVWFVGAHADVGGGYINYYDRMIDAPGRPASIQRSLDDISLDWMIRRIKKYHPEFPLQDTELRLQGQGINQTWALHSEQHEARNGIYKAFPLAWRSIGNCAARFGSWPRQRFVSQDRHAAPIGEMVHISALERWGKPFNVGWIERNYEPRNLRLAIDQIDRTYRDGGAGPTDAEPFYPLYVVGWSGERLEPSDNKGRGMVRELIDPILRRGRDRARDSEAGNG